MGIVYSNATVAASLKLVSVVDILLLFFNSAI